MNIYILRHGLAVEKGDPAYPKDADRPLTPEGKSKLKKIVKAMDAMGLKFDVIWSSPYKRTRQTAEIVASQFHAADRLKYSRELTPQGSTEELIDAIKHSKPSPEAVLLVGHEPFLSELISLLVSGETSTLIELKKGGLAKLCSESLKHGRCATLQWLLTPRQMAEMA